MQIDVKVCALTPIIAEPDATALPVVVLGGGWPDVADVRMKTKVCPRRGAVRLEAFESLSQSWHSCFVSSTSGCRALLPTRQGVARR